jgi:hypothetical protein
MTHDQESILKHSDDARELKQVASRLATSSKPPDLAGLARFLPQKGFLGRLDPDNAYDGVYTSLRLARVIGCLADNTKAGAHDVLLGLIDAPGFQGHILRIQLLIHALASVRPSPPKAISYWDRFSPPDGALAHDVIDALIANQSPPAMELLESRLGDPAHDERPRKAWLRQLVLPRRNDLPLLRCSHRLLLRPVTPDIGRLLVEALFDYDREGWYSGCSPPVPPPIAQALPASRELYRELAELALARFPLGPNLASKVKGVLQGLGRKDE